ncbi:MAG: hypothetical protein E6J88_17100 [Deltaproteobacteria bacterium]|nr:MAG: hypothetical protein E6J88_17100 [Deltaproteobacteria bacterium]
MQRILPFLVFLAIALILIGGMHYYVWARVVRDTHLPEAAARVVTLAIVALGVSLPLAMIASRLFAKAVVRPAMWVAFVWMGMGFLFVAFFGIADLGRLAAALVRRISGTPLDPAKRVFLARTVAAGVGGVVAGLSAVGIRSALGEVQVKELDIFLRGLPAELAGFKLVQISDVHVGPLLRKDWVAQVVDRIAHCGRRAACTSPPATTSTTRASRNGTRTCPRSASGRCATSASSSLPGSIWRESKTRPARPICPAPWPAAIRRARWSCSRTSRGSSWKRRATACR